MSEFFESEIVREELEEINELQEEVYKTIMEFPQMSREERVEHIDCLLNLLDKQKIMYTRLSLSNDPQAREMKENLRKSISVMGFPPNTDMQTLFTMMHETISNLKSKIDI